MRELRSTSLLLFVLSLSLVYRATCKGLNTFITHYEPVEYDHHSLMWHHNRVRRSLMGQQRIELEFFAFNRPFELVLEPDRDLFHPNFTLLHDDTVVDQHHTKSYMYTGTEAGDTFSRVRGNLAHGVFDGVVRTLGEVYYIEPASRYSQHLHKDSNFHSIIYRQSDLNSSSLRGASCGSRDRRVEESMLDHQESLSKANSDQHHSDSQYEHVINKRQSGTRDLNLVRCWISLRIDYKAYTNYMSTGQDPVATVLNIVSMGSDIFRSTDFNMDSTPDNIQFGIQKMIVERTPPAPGTFFANDFIGVEAFLNEHSKADYSDYCLAYRFTHRDFDGGVVGLAYVAAQPPSNNIGGICENARTVSGQQQTLNTGIVTSLNYGQNIAPSLTALTFAHECGHNFGSNHDQGDPPAGGAYIMYAFATAGSQPNNDEFSPASRTMMNNVIAVRGQGQGGCFVEGGNLCGNSLVDEGEECDCGPPSNHNAEGICMSDTCCFGRNCTLAPNVLCSPDQGPCCNSTCQYVQESDNVTCSMETDCAFSQICGGSDFLCPLPDAKSPPVNSTFILCNNEEGVCDGTACNGTICLALNLTDCECSDKSQSCHVCCMLGSSCISTMDIATNNTNNLRRKLPGMMGRFVQVGLPCANFTGYCDFLNNCTAVDEEGALFRLANLFFNSEIFRRTVDFITRMWWVVVLGVLGLFVVMFLIVILFHCLLPRAEIVKSHRRPTIKKRRVRPNQNHHSQPAAYSSDYNPNYGAQAGYYDEYDQQINFCSDD